MKIADYAISKLSFTETHRIDTVTVVELDDNNQFISEFESKDRNWMIQKNIQFKTFCSISKNNNGNWSKKTLFNYDEIKDVFTWNFHLPKNIIKRKTFISYYHKEDQYRKDIFENLFGDLIVNKSVQDGDIDSNNSDEYAKQLIQKGYLVDTTILVVLIGAKTKCRKHVDWEISGALNLKVGDKYAGLLGIILPNHPDYGNRGINSNILPSRLADNFESGYAIIRDWSEDRALIQSYIEEAYENRSTKAEERINSRIQMENDTCI